MQNITSGVRGDSERTVSLFRGKGNSVDCSNHSFCARGGTAHFLDNWQAITSDAWVPNTVWGLEMGFFRYPVQNKDHTPIKRRRATFCIKKEEVSALLSKGAIIPEYPAEARDSFCEVMDHI